MPYQNNNNRLVPQVQKGITAITPIAQVTNQLITPQINGSKEYLEASNAQYMSNALAEIGRGVSSIDTALQKSANEANVNQLIIEQQLNNEDIGNWKAIQKQLPFIQQFNPYYKDKYMQTSAMVLAKEAMNKLYTDPEYYKKDNQVIKGMMQNITEELSNTYKQLGMSPKDVDEALGYVMKQQQDFYTKYYAANNEYTFGLVIDSEAHNMARAMRAVSGTCRTD